MTLPQSTIYIHPDFQKQFLASSTSSRPCDWFHEKSISGNDVNHNNNKHELDQTTAVWTEAATQWKRMKRMVDQNQKNNSVHQPNPQVGRNFGLLNRQRRNRQQNSHNTQHLSSSSSSSSHESDGDDFDANNKPDVQGTPLGSFKSFARGEKTLVSLLGISDDSKNNNNNNSSSSLMFRSLESVLEVETVQDMEKWSSCLSDIQNNNNCNHVMSTNRSSSSSTSSFVTSTPPPSATNTNNFSLQKLLAPEAQRWMNLAEKNLLLFSLSSDKNQNSNNSTPDFVNAIKNYSNALQSQLNFCLSPIVKTSNDDKTKDQDGYSTASEVRKNPMTSTSHQESGSSISKIDSSENNNTSVYFSSRIPNVHQKSIIALILSNRAACRLALLDFEGCLIDANEAINFSSKHASALLRLTYCLLFGCSLASSSSSTSTSSSSVALLEKCESVSYSSFQTLFSSNSRNALDAPTTTNTNMIIPISVISNSAMVNLREIVKNLNEFENFRNKNCGNDNNVVQWLQSLESASSAAQNIFCPRNNNNNNSSVTVRDPRLEILKLELLIASGAFEDAAVNATSLLSSYSTSFLPQVWSLRGSCVFRATPDGNSASLAATCFKKSADCYRKLSQDIGRIFCFVPFLSASQKNANSSCNNSLSYLTISASKQTSIGDSLQKFDRLETKLSHFFDDYFSNRNDNQKSINISNKSSSSSSSSNHHHNFHEIIQIATEILCLDLLGHRLVRAFTLLRRSILFLLLISQENKNITSQNNSNRNSIASRGIDDATTALKLLEIDGEFFAASSCPTSTRNGSKKKKNSHHDSKSISTLSSSCLPFTIALFCIRAQLHQLVSAFGRASEDLEFALLCSSILSEQRQQDLKNNNNDGGHDFWGQNTEQRDDDDEKEEESGIFYPPERHNAKRFSHSSSASTSSSSSPSALLLRHPEIATYCNRTFLFDLQELIKSQRFAYHQTYQHQQQEHQRKANKFFKRQREEAAKGNNKYSQEDFDREEEELKKNAARPKRKLDGRGVDDDDDGDGSENENEDERENVVVVKLSYYDILGIARTAEHSDVVKAYRAAALKWHPDKWMDSSKNDYLRKQAEQNFKLINSAYLVLKDEIQRIKYDASL